MRFFSTSLAVPALLVSSLSSLDVARADYTPSWLKRGSVNQASTCAPQVTIGTTNFILPAVASLVSSLLQPTFTLGNGGKACDSCDVVDAWITDASGTSVIVDCNLSQHGQTITATCPISLSSLRVGFYQLCLEIEDPYRNVVNTCQSFTVSRSGSAAPTTSSSSSATAATTPATFAGGPAKIGNVVTTSSSTVVVSTSTSSAQTTTSGATTETTPAAFNGNNQVVKAAAATTAWSTSTTTSSSTSTTQTTPAAFNGGAGAVKVAATTATTTTTTTSAAPAATSTTAAQACANSVYFSPSNLTYATTDTTTKVASGAYFNLQTCSTNQGLSVTLQTASGTVLSNCAISSSTNQGAEGQTVTCNSIGGSLAAGSYKLCYVTQDSTGKQGNGCYPITINHPAASVTSTSTTPAATATTATSTKPATTTAAPTTTTTSATPTPTLTPAPTTTPATSSSSPTTAATTTNPPAFNGGAPAAKVAVASPAARKRQVAEDNHEVLPSGFACPVLFTACPVWGRPHLWECVDVLTDIDSCGGCPGEPGSQDCSSIPGADEVHCIRGQCVVATCDKWHTLAADGTCVGRPSKSIYEY